jgi:predicted acetyltransferase
MLRQRWAASRSACAVEHSTALSANSSHISARANISSIRIMVANVTVIASPQNELRYVLSAAKDAVPTHKDIHETRIIGDSENAEPIARAEPLAETAK